MPYKCCVPECKGNYPGENRVHVFRFPKDADLLAKWLRAIPRDNFQPTKNHRVCEQHFTKGSILTSSKCFDQKCGNFVEVPLQYPKLAPGSIPTIFPNCPYISKPNIVSRKSRDEKIITEQATLQKVLMESRVEFEAYKNKKQQEVHEPSVPVCSLGSANVKLEEFELVETFESGLSNVQNDEQCIDDPLIKVEDEEATCSRTNIAPEPLLLLPETSGQPRTQQVSKKSARKSKETGYCRLCLNQTNKVTQLPLGDLDLNYPDKSHAFKESKRKKINEVQKMISLCLPFYESLTFNPVLCLNCLIRLKSCYEFVNQCKENQKLIENYIDYQSNNEMIANINEIADYKLIQNQKKYPSIPEPIHKTIIVPSKTYPSASQKRAAQNVIEATITKRQNMDLTHNQNSKELLEPDAEIQIKEEPLLHYQEDITDNIKVEPEYIDSPILMKIDLEEDIQASGIENRLGLNDGERISQNREITESVYTDRGRISRNKEIIKRVDPYIGRISQDNICLPNQRVGQGNISSRKMKPGVLAGIDLFCTSDANCMCVKCTK